MQQDDTQQQPPLSSPISPSTGRPDIETDVDTDTDAGTAQPVDERHQRRIALMQQLFAWTFHNQIADEEARFKQDNPDVAKILEALPQLDEQIQTTAPERPLKEINKVDLAILRLIMFEWTSSRTPVKVLIDEGVELAKEFGTDSSPKFVNGVLAKLLTDTTRPN